MRLWTISNNRTLWKNHLLEWSGAACHDLLSTREYSASECTAFQKAVSAFALRSTCFFCIENDYMENGWRSMLHHEISPEHLLICDHQPVGVLFITRHTSCSPVVYHADALFFDKADPLKGESWADECLLTCTQWENSTREYHSCRIRIIEICPAVSSFSPIPLPNLV